MLASAKKTAANRFSIPHQAPARATRQARAVSTKPFRTRLRHRFPAFAFGEEIREKERPTRVLKEFAAAVFQVAIGFHEETILGRVFHRESRIFAHGFFLGAFRRLLRSLRHG